MRVHQSDLLLMRGSGVGSIFSNIFRGLIPLAKTVFSVVKKVAKSSAGQSLIKSAKNHAIKAGLDIANDALQGKNIKKAAKKSMKRAGQDLITDVSEQLKKGRGGASCSTSNKIAWKGGNKKKKKKKKNTTNIATSSALAKWM